MNKYTPIILVFFTLLLTYSIGFLITPEAAYSETAAQSETVPSATADSESDQTDREDLTSSHQQEGDKFMLQWLHMLDSKEEGDVGDVSVLAYAPSVPGDLLKTIQSTGESSGTAKFWGVLFRSILAVGLGFALAFISRKIIRSKLVNLGELPPPESETVALLWTSLLRNLPALIGVLVLGVASTIIFLIMAGDIGVKGRMLFQLILGIILLFSLSAIISRILFSPDNSSLRPFKIDQSLVKPLYNAVKYSIAVLLSGMLIVNMVMALGAQPQSVSWVIIILGTIVIGLYCYLIMYLKQPVSAALLVGLEEEGGGWIKRQIATYWHGLALIYLALVWFIWIGQQITGVAAGKGELIVSLLIVPIYFLLSYAGKLLIKAVVESLQLGKVEEPDPFAIVDEEEQKEEFLKRQAGVAKKTFSIFRIVLIAVLAVWVLSLWGYRIPFASAAMSALFQSIIILALALISWRAASKFIERKLEEATPEVEEDKEDEDDEFGGAAPRGRAHTLLPMLKKVVGTFLMVMVVLIILSALGVNIGPLLAGAGVLGLAIGFGAQKLVSDVLSGFFFLLDDAFRVGEYIQAGSIRGTVEAITLRNVMLRHHMGMLQVVPHSDLGAITNYMRGGIVIKFTLEFPYDTDIDKVRKIIKKVGVAMLEDEELGDDFIRPVKSQGVYEITNSVMVIRVKFTAKPGKQFVIKREAFRRITEALNAKGIYYAHRKVIVDLPEEVKRGSLDQETQQKIAQAGAAAVQAAEAEQQQQPKPDPSQEP